MVTSWSFKSELGLLNAQVEQPFKKHFVGMVHFEQVQLFGKPWDHIAVPHGNSIMSNFDN